MSISSLIPSSSRRDIVIIATIICLLTIIISFRSFFGGPSGWRNPVEDLPSLGAISTHNQEKTDATAVLAGSSSSISPSLTSAASSISSAAQSIPAPSASSATKGRCDGFPDTKDILVVVKTGATEAFDKLPIHFLTTLLCAEDYLLFSDMDQVMAGQHLIDSLDQVSQDVMTDNSDFDLYRQLQQYRKLREDPRELNEGGNGWNLDKYKFLHMLLKTYRARPNASWYVFIEADTALIWDNLVEFLRGRDPKKPHYFGSPTYLDIEFAHGGSGYFISQAAMKKAVGNHPEIADKYDSKVSGICCGDAMVARVLLDVDITLTKSWPHINGEKPSTLPYAENHWCQPVITMHHLTAQEVSAVWNFEQERKARGITEPLLFVDLFRHFVNSNLLPERSDWDNLSNDITYDPPPDTDPEQSYNGRTWAELGDVERASPSSFENCKKACEADGECMQFKHWGNHCGIGRSIKLGKSRQPDGDEKWRSGWSFPRIGKFKAEMGNCTEPVWVV